MIYLDNAASTKISPRVRDVMKNYLDSGMFGNPDSRHAIGLDANAIVEEARRNVADSIGADPSQIFFTSGGTESNNLAILGSGARCAVCSEGEHPSVYNAVKAFKVNDIVKLTPYGTVDYDDLAVKMKRVEGHDAVIAISAVNNETGAVNDVEKIVEMKPADSWLHIDFVQAFGQYPINVREMGIDSLSISSHKVHGPQGVGALFVARPDLLHPILKGAETQEMGKRPGTKNVLGIIGFGAACSDISNAKIDPVIRNFFVKCLLEEMESTFGEETYDIIRINGWANPKTVSATFRGADAETMIMMLSTMGVCVSAGSACHAHISKPSRVLKAMGLSDEDAMCTIRVSFSSMTTVEELAEAAVKIVTSVAAIKGLR